MNRIFDFGFWILDFGPRLALWRFGDLAIWRFGDLERRQTSIVNRQSSIVNRQSLELPNRRRRGLSLLELLLAMSVTAVVAAAIAAMLGAVSTGVGTRRDCRTVMVLANAAESRLSSYIAASRCILDVDNSTDLTLWMNDSRVSLTVHATEIRWLHFDKAAGKIDVYYVKFPDGWSQVACDLEDKEYALSTNWNTVLASYEANGWIGSRTLVDNLDSVAVSTDSAPATSARHLHVTLGFHTATDAAIVPIACTIRQHQAPAK